MVVTILPVEEMKTIPFLLFAHLLNSPVVAQVKDFPSSATSDVVSSASAITVHPTANGAYRECTNLSLVG